MPCLCVQSHGLLTRMYVFFLQSQKNIYPILFIQLLLSASEDKRLVLHDVRSSPGGTVASFSGHTSWVLSVAVSPDGLLGLSGYCKPPFYLNQWLIKWNNADQQIKASKYGISEHAPQFRLSRIRIKYGLSHGDPNCQRSEVLELLSLVAKMGWWNGGEALVLEGRERHTQSADLLTAFLHRYSMIGGLQCKF